jgi:hypothetical protein
MTKINVWYGIVLPIVIACVVTVLVVGGLYSLDHPEQSSTKAPVKEYWVFEHDIEPFRAYTSQGIFLFQTEDEWNQLELNHTYMCEETYSNISLANCTEVKGA